jgi:hypothetical protein
LSSVVVPLALLSALLYALSDFLEQRAASLEARFDPVHAPTTGTLRVRRTLAGAVLTMRRLVRNRRWVAGWGVGTVALLVQAVALRVGSIAVVQTLQVATLLFAIPLSTVYSATRPRVLDYVGAGLVCAGVATVIAIRGHAEPAVRQRPSPLLFLLIAAVVCVLVVFATGAPGPARVTILATAAGVALGTGAALVKLTTTDLTTAGLLATARDWPGYCFGLCVGAGMVIQQLAFAAGRLAAATTAMIVVNPLVGYVIAVLGFGEHLPDGGRLAGLALGGACAAVGVTVLSQSPVLFGDDELHVVTAALPEAACAGQRGAP